MQPDSTAPQGSEFQFCQIKIAAKKFKTFALRKKEKSIKNSSIHASTDVYFYCL